ncbi:MAG: glutamate synthase [Christensenellales bacterium]
MISIDAQGLEFETLNQKIRSGKDDCEVYNCLGQRFIATGMNDKQITLYGTPGNAMGAYLNGATIVVNGNAQDAVGDTMNDGKIIIYGNIGDAAGYAMRGGAIYVKGNAGYRAGIHMKAYKEKIPVLVIGGSAGSFLGEYQAGGIIIALGLESNHPIVGNFPCTGMHGGKMLLRSDCSNVVFPANVHATRVTSEQLSEFLPYLYEFCDLFGYERDKVMDFPFTLVEPDSKNPYKQMYVMN